MVLSFREYIHWSVAGHLLAFIVLLIAPGSFLKKSYRLSQEKIVWVAIPKGTSNQWGSPMKKAAALPMTTIEEQKKALTSPAAGEKKPSMTYTPPPKKESSKPPPRSPPVPKRPGHPDSKIEQALSRIQKEVAMKKAEPEAAQIPETQAGGFTFGTTTGPYVSPDDPEYVLYQAKIRHRIMNQWILPMKYAEQPLGLICRIIVHINDKGEVVEKEWESRSGDPSFDMSAMRAIDKSAPLDIPPKRLEWEVYNEGFIVEFKPQSQQAAQ